MTKYTTYTIIFLFVFASFAMADQGSGDSFGYIWTDTETPAPSVSYNWIDLSAETSIFGDVFDDSLSAAIPLGFTFDYYGTSRSQVYISSNGWVSFVNPGVDVSHPVNAAIPSATGPDALIAPFWDDLASTTGNNGGVYWRRDGTSPNQQFIIEWHVINGTDVLRFEMIIDQRTNLIKFQYNTVAAAYTGGGSATIGIKSTSSLGNQYSFNSAGSVSANSAILFHNESISDYSASLDPEDVSISDFVSFTYTINNIDPGGAQGLGKIDRMAIGNPFSTTPTITSVTIDGQSAFIQNNTSKPTDPNIATWFYKTSGPSDSLIVQTSLFSVGQNVVITYLQGIPSVPEGDYTFASTVDAALYPTSAMAASPQPDVAVSGGSVDYILIRDDSNGGGSVFGTHTMTTDESLTLYAAGYDAGDNFVGDQDVTWTLTGELDGGGGTGTNFIFNPSVAPTSGTIQAELVSIGATDETGFITVNVGILNSLQIRTAALEGGSPVTNFNMTTDDTQRFWAAGYDTEGNYRGDESVSWTSTLGISGTATSINYSPSAPISGTLTATSGSVSDVADIDVTTGALDYLVVRDAPGGVGAVVAAYIMDTDGTLTLYAAGYDAENNYKQDYVATWTLFGSLDQPGTTNSVFTFSPSTAPTTGSITATVGGNKSDATGTITVDPGALDDLEIRTAANNGGSLVTTFPMTTDDDQTFWAAGFDSEGNYIGDESVTWTSTLGIGGTGSSILFSPDAPISGTLTATSGTIFYTTGTIDVTIGALDYLIIRTAPGGGGAEVSTVAMTTDDGLTLYSAGYDADGNFRQDENATWTLTGSLDGPGSSGTSFNFNPFTGPTTGSILATVGGKSDATGTITVDPGALAYVIIRSDSNNSGTPVSTFPMTTDDTKTFWSAGYDAEDNYRGDEATTNWTSSGDLGISGSGSSIFFAPSAPVSGTLTATAAGATPYQTGLISVTVASVDHIIVRDAPNGGGSEVTTHTMTTDETLTLYAAGYDAQNNFVENSVVNWSSTGTLDAISGSGTSIVFNPVTGPSLGTIVATAGPLSDATENITVDFGTLSSVLIRTAANNGGSQVITLTMTTEDTRTFWSAGYDADGNYRGDEGSTVWTSSGTLGISGSGDSILFEPTVPVTGTITASASGATPYQTGLISVTVSSVDHIIVRDAPDGLGNEVTTHTMTTDETLTLYAAGYDGEDNFVENSVVNWTLTGTLVGTPVSNSSFVFDPADAPTNGTIVAQLGTKQDATGTITVDPGALASVLIRDADNGGGNVVTTFTMNAGDSEEFWAAGYDAEDNYRGNETSAVWTSTFGLGGSGSPFTFNPTVPGDGTVTATVSGIPYTTGTITVNGGTLDHLVIRDGPGGTGNDLRGSNFSLSADGSRTLYAAGYDVEDNYIGDQLVDWFSTGTLDVIDVLNVSNFTFNPVIAPAVGTLGITNGTLASATGDIDVTVGALSYITINSSPGPGGTEVNTETMSAGESLTFWAVGYDSDGNYISEITADWSSTGSLDAVTETGTSIVFNPLIAPSLGTIVATAGLFSDATGLITVEEGLLDHIEIRTAPDGGGVIVGITNLTADQSLTMYAAAYDASDNFIRNQIVSWSTTGSLDDTIATGSSFTFNPVLAPTSGTIVATSGEYTRQTGAITVSEGEFDHITINSSSGPDGVPVGDLTMTADDTRTFYAASYDADNNFLGMVAATWNKTGTLDVVSGTGPSYVFNPVTAPTQGTITATFSGQNDATGTITVNTGALAYILITDETGVEIGDVPTNVGVDTILQSRGFDQDNNYRGREIAIWTSTGSLDDPNFIGETYVFTPETAPTTGTIIATSEADPSKSDATGLITVEEGPLTRIQIRTQPDGEGQEFESYSLTADENVWLFAAGYDGADNFKGNIAVSWSTTGGNLESISGTDTSFNFSPTVAPASGLIRITSGPMIDETGTIKVSPGAVVGISDANGLSGQRTTVAGSPQLVRVFAGDQHGNPVSGETVNFSPPGMMSVPSDVTDLDGIAESVYNTPRNEESSIVQASVSGLSPVNFTVYAINYVSGSLNPLVVQRGGSPSFTVRISNPGNTLVPLNTASSNFSISSGIYNYSASLISPTSLQPNSSNITLTFAATEVDENFPGGSHTGEIQLVGSGSYSSMNGILQTDIGELTIGTDAITIGTIQSIGPFLQGEQNIQIRVPVTNVGPVLEIDAFPATRIEFKRNDNGQPQVVDNLVRTDGLSSLQSGGVINYLEFEFDLPSEYPTGLIDVFVILSLDEGNLVIDDQEPKGSFNVLLAGNANYVPGSLDPDEVVPSESVYFSASFQNTGSANIVLSPEVSTIQILGSGASASNLVSQFTLQGSSTTELFFDPIMIPQGLSPGSYDIRFHLYGTVLNSEFETIVVVDNALTLLAPANLRIAHVNIVPDQVKQGQTGIEVRYSIQNQGQSAAELTNIVHNFIFFGGGQVPDNQWNWVDLDPELPSQIAAGATIPFTTFYSLSLSATTGTVSPSPILKFHDIKTPAITNESNTIVTNDVVDVVEPASVKIVQLEGLAPNSPNVNEEQQFNLALTLENTGADPIQTAWVSIFRNQELEPFRELILSTIAPDGQKSISFAHSEDISGTYLYKAFIDSAKDAVGDPVDIIQPDDRDELMSVQIASRLEIDASILSKSIKYDSLTVSEDQEFFVQARITNFGESAFSDDGNGRFVLRLPDSTFTFVNDPMDSLRSFTSLDTLVEWAIQASGVSPGENYEELAFSLIDIPVDKNTGEDVDDIAVLDNAVHIISVEKGTIEINHLSIFSPEGAIDGVLSTKQEFTVQSKIVFNHAIASDGRTAEIHLPFGYSLKAGHQLIVDSLETGIDTIFVEWTIISLDRDRDGDELFVTASGYDQNSGLPVTLSSNEVPLSVVERTDLSMALQILKTSGSPGDTLSVGQLFTLQAVVTNDGNAQAVGGGKVYLEGVGENPAIVYSDAAQEDTLSYTIGETVEWKLEIVNLPDGNSGLHSEVFQLMDELEKEKARVKEKSINKITNTNQVRELYLELSEKLAALVTEEMNLTVKMSQIPEDINTNQTAFTRDSVVTITTFVEPVAEIILLTPVVPQKVSTFQEFKVIISGTYKNSLKDPMAHLFIPESFKNANGNVDWMDLPLEPGSNTAEFTINVPPTHNYFGAKEESLSVYLTGKDKNTGEEVLPTAALWETMTVEMKPEIYMGKEVIAPIAAQESGLLSHGQSFVIEVWPELVPSEKDLDYAEIDADGRIKLNDEIFTQYKFERVEDEEYDQTFTQLGQKLRFTVRAPRVDQTALFDFRFVDLPRDKNSQDPVVVNSDSGSVSLPISVVEKKVTVIMENNPEKPNFTRGEGQHLIMSVDISNAGFLDPLTINGLGLRFIARSDTTSHSNSAVADIFDKILIIDFEEYIAGSEKLSNITSYAEYVVTETNAQNPLQVTFDEIGVLGGNESVKLAVVAQFKKGESSRSFRAILNNVDAYDDSPEHLVSIIDGEGRSIENSPDMMTQVLSIISTDQEKTFGNFPNPFGRSPNLTTDIRFLINSPSDVTLRIFSLAGELVKSAWNDNLTNLDPDVYYLAWDGKNDEGDTVLNGVYICVIEIRSSEGSKTFTTKIAYIK